MNQAQRPVSRLAVIGLVLGLGAVAAMLAGGLGHRAGWWHFTSGLKVVEWGVYGALLALVVSLVAAVLTWPDAARKRGFPLALVGVLATLPVIATAAYWVHAARTYPMINDISTDLDEPPVFWEMPNPTDHPGEAFAAKQRAAYPDIVPLMLAAPAPQVFGHARALVRERGWSVVAEDEADLRIEATEKSRLFGFVDEVVLRIAETPDGTRVDMRSRSRLGRSDLGVNAARIRAFLTDLAARSR